MASGSLNTARGPDWWGTAGLRPLEESGLEIFYSLAPGAWGQGYATEAARAVVEYGLGSLGLPEVLAEVDEGNTASVAVVKRLGMTPYAVVPGVPRPDDPLPRHGQIGVAASLPRGARRGRGHIADSRPRGPFRHI